jgi:hypothetical protein
MYADSQLELSDSQAVTATAVCANVIDTLTLGLGAGAQAGAQLADRLDAETLYVVVQTAVACTDTSSDATLTITLETSANSDLSSPTVIMSSRAIPFADFSPAGAQVWVMPLPPSAAWKRYVGLRYSVASGPLTAGAFDAILTPTIQRNRVYKTTTPVAQ